MTGLRMQTTPLIAPLALLVFLAAPCAQAQDSYLFEADLSGAYEVPPTSAPQTGHIELVLNAEMTEAAYVIEYDPIPDETAAHFHLAPPGANGPVVESLPADNPKIGVWMISPEHVDALFEGHIYVNIHSTEFPGGAIRGNLTTYVVSAEASSWSQIKTLFN